MLKKLTFYLSGFIFTLLFITSTKGQLSEPDDTIYVANWNVENLFDVIDDPEINDSDFLPSSDKEWNQEKLERKLNNLVKVINFMNNGCGPDILGLEEIENINVLKLLIYKFHDRDYIIAHRDSPDERGIDACLIYDRNIFDIVDIVPIHVEIPTGYNTRDILHTVLLHKKSKTKLHVFVNHWPSRIGGEEKTEPNRIAAAKYLRNAVDSLLKFPTENQIIILGDFNDEPDNNSITKILKAKDFSCFRKKFSKNVLLNLSYPKFADKEGSYLYNSDWNMLDQIIASTAFRDGKSLDYKCESFEVVKPDFMVIKEGSKEGGPSATYAGKKYFGGYSDHFPVAAKFYYQKRKEKK